MLEMSSKSSSFKYNEIFFLNTLQTHYNSFQSPGSLTSKVAHCYNFPPPRSTFLPIEEMGALKNIDIGSYAMKSQIHSFSMGTLQIFLRGDIFEAL